MSVHRKSIIALGVLSKQYSGQREIGRVREDEAHVANEINELRAVIEEQLEEQEDMKQLRMRLDDTMLSALQMLRSGNLNSVDELRLHLEPEIMRMRDAFRSEERFADVLKTTQEIVLTKLAAISSLLQSEGALRERLMGKKGSLESEIFRLQKDLELEIESRKEFEQMNVKLDTQVQVLTQLRNKEAKDKLRLVDSRAQIEVELDQLKLRYEESTSLLREAEKKLVTLQVEKEELQNKVKTLQDNLSHETKIRQDAIRARNEMETELNIIQEESLRMSLSLHQERLMRTASESTTKKLSKDLAGITDRPKSARLTPRTMSASSERPRSARTTMSTPRPPSSARSSRPVSVRSISSVMTTESGTLNTPHITTARSIRPMWIPDIRCLNTVDIKIPLLESPTYIQGIYSHIIQHKPQLMELANMILAKNEEGILAFREQNYLKCISDLESAIILQSKVWDVKDPQVLDSWRQVFLLCNEFSLRLIDHDISDVALKLLKKAESIVTSYVLENESDLHYTVLSNLAYFHLIKGKPNTALQYLQKAIRLDNQHDAIRQAEMNARMGFAFWAIGNHNAALNHLRLACELIDLDLGQSTDTSCSKSDSILIDRRVSQDQARVIILHNTAIELFTLGIGTESLITAGRVIQMSSTLLDPAAIRDCVLNMNHIIGASAQNPQSSPRRPFSASSVPQPHSTPEDKSARPKLLRPKSARV
eukprot:TRINITY_DN3363_c0_g1_i5.p1 TRINITY_DN3363_c0_g1~~TRINITY_DN3363_c0_g1_i5.p1  ORF type:complete len:710 (+),score=135.77 TRINITY_DN3363_c0_g1_i5:495-2624(+)